MSLFCAVNDEDGIDDVEYLYLIQDRDGLDWKLTKDNWREREIDGVTWLGSDSLEHPDGPAFPRGNYRVVLIDKSGERAERDVPVQTVPTDAVKVPTLSLEGSTLAVGTATKWPDYSVIFEDGAGATLKAYRSALPAMDLDAAWGSPSWRTDCSGVRVVAFDEASRIAVRTGLLDIGRRTGE